MTRRIGQNGNVFQQNQTAWNPAAPAYGRFWIDTPERRKRRTVALGICPTRSRAKRKLREFIEHEGINKKSSFMETTSPATTFREQSELWIQALPTRRRRPVKPATIVGWRVALDKWILPAIGEMLLAEVANSALKLLIEKMADGGLAPKTIVTYTQTVKMVVASAVNSEGDQIYPRKWNHDFVGMPIVQKEKQPRPTVTEAEVVGILAKASPRYAPLFALLAGTGLRIGEALALKKTDLGPDCRMLFVRRSMWRGKEQEPKTPAAIRVVDMPEPLAAMLREYAANKSGYLFPTLKTNRPLAQRNVLRALHDTGMRVGFHAFRRFRAQNLRRSRVPEDLTRLWLGHAGRSITDLYAVGLQHDEAWRREWCDRVGLGFALFGPYWAINQVVSDSQQAA
ncbi:MAG: site-specific integrase [Candidatus Sulfotelmatobacter sp.]